MPHYLISFPQGAMTFPEVDLPQVAEESRAVIREAKAAGVYRFAGGLDEDLPTLLVDGDGHAAEGAYPGRTDFRGGFTVLTLDSREEAVRWAAKIAKACRCDQEVREFMWDPES